LDSTHIVDYPHPILNAEITAIGGHYVLTHEHRFTIGGTATLVFEGYGIVSASCCGSGGCRYAVVPGELIAYRYARLPGGQWVSRVVPLNAPLRRRPVRQWLAQHRTIYHVVFV
jgi:hypothetical protein